MRRLMVKTGAESAAPGLLLLLLGLRLHEGGRRCHHTGRAFVGLLLLLKVGQWPERRWCLPARNRWAAHRWRYQGRRPGTIRQTQPERMGDGLAGLSSIFHSIISVCLLVCLPNPFLLMPA